MTFKDAVEEWTDWDAAERSLAIALGVDERLLTKATFWSNNPLGEALAACLQQLVSAQVLEHRDEPDHQYRWARS